MYTSYGTKTNTLTLFLIGFTLFGFTVTVRIYVVCVQTTIAPLASTHDDALMQSATTRKPILFPSEYDGTLLLSYSHQWKEHLRQFRSLPLQLSNSTEAPIASSSTVFGLTFYCETARTSADSWSNGQQQWLIGCTSQGEICIWKLTDSSTSSLDDDEDNEISFGVSTIREAMVADTLTSKPAARLKVSQGVLYTCKVVQRADATWLVVSGDDGTWGTLLSCAHVATTDPLPL
jgi:hypothetical protein